MAADTPGHIEAMVLDALRRMRPAEKAAVLARMVAMSDQLALAGVRRQYPAVPDTWGYHLALRRLPPERQAEAAALLWRLPALVSPANPVDIALRVSTCLAGFGLRALVVGSFASALVGEYRTIRDLDVLVPDHALCYQALIEAMRPAFVFAEDARAAALVASRALEAGGPRITLYDRATGFQVDLFMARDDAASQAVRARAVPADLGAGTVWVPGAEDTLLATLRWYTMHHSDVLWRDTQAIIRVQRERLDLASLRARGAERGIAGLLERALAGERPPPAGG